MEPLEDREISPASGSSIPPAPARGLGTALALAALLPFVAIVVAPLTFYFGNRAELHFGLGELVGPVALLFAAATLTLLPLTLLAGRHRLGGRLISGLLVGVAAAAWLQSQLFAWDFGPLDGRGIDWSRWQAHMRLELAAWIALPLAGILLGAARARLLGQVVALAGALSIATAFWAAPPVDRDALLGEHRTSFRFHPTENTILIVLDSFHSRAFHTILQEHPQELEVFQGFTYYPDTVGGFPTTYPSIPYLLTGRLYRNRVPIREFMNEAYEEGVPRAYQRAGYGVTLTSIAPNTLYPGVGAGDEVLVGIPEVVADLHGAPVPPLLVYLDGGLFRLAPTASKDRVYGDGKWLFAYRYGRGRYPPDSHGNDVRFLEAFERHAAVGSERRGELHFYHFFTPHIPVRVGESLQYDPEAEDNWRGYVRQARGALSLVRRMLATLERLGVADNAEIVVTSDHGLMRFPRWEIFGEGAADAVGEVSERVHMAALPLLLHKPKGATGRLAISELPVTLGDVPCLLSLSASAQRCAALEAARRSGRRTRHFLFYDWRHDDWSREYMPPMREYVAEGHAWDPRSWSGGRRTFAPGVAQEQEPFGSYRLGEELDLSRASDDGLRHLAGGWSSPEEHGTWTNGHRSHLILRLAEAVEGSLELRLLAAPFRGGGELQDQPVAVWVNDQLVAEWRAARPDWYDATIPPEVASSGVFEVRLDLPEAAAPAEWDPTSGDHRLLGLHVHRVVLEPSTG